MLPVAPAALAEFLLSASQADLQTFDLAELAFALGLSDADDEVVADLLQSAALGRVRPEEGHPYQCSFRRPARFVGRCLDDRADEARRLAGDLLRRAGPVVFEPPEDGLDEHGGDDAGDEPVGVAAGEVLA
jgi:hypothetical protein